MGVSTTEEGGNKSWMSLCLAATKLMDEKTQSDATTDPDDEDNANAVNNLLCFETIGGGDSSDSNSNLNNVKKHNHSHLSGATMVHPYKEAKRRKKDIPVLTKRHKSSKLTRYIGGVPAISKRDIAWNVMFKRLQEFKHEYEHCNVPQGFATDLELATWVKNQRQAYRYMLDNKTDKKPTKRISPDRVTRLNHLGFEWRKYVRADDWSDHYFGKRTTTPRQKMTNTRVHHNHHRQPAVSTFIPPVMGPPVSLGPIPTPYESSSDVDSRIPAELLCNEKL